MAAVNKESPEKRLDISGLVERYGFSRAWWQRAVYRGLPHTKAAGNRTRTKVWVRLKDAEAYLQRLTATEAAPQPAELRK